MPLPALSPALGSGIKSLKSIFGGKSQPAANDSTQPGTGQPAPTPAPTKKEYVPIQRVPLSRQSQVSTQSIQRIGQAAGTAGTATAANEEANQKAIARSQGSFNPLVPLMTQISHTLMGMDKTLNDILGAINNLKGRLESGMEDSGLGFDSDGFEKNKKKGRERRNRRNNRRTRGGRGSRGPRSFKNRVGRGLIRRRHRFGIGMAVPANYWVLMMKLPRM